MSSVDPGSPKPNAEIPLWQLGLLYVAGFLGSTALVSVITHTWLGWLSEDRARLLAGFLYIGGLILLSQRSKGVRWLPAVLKSIAFAGCIGAMVWLTDRLFP